MKQISDFLRQKAFTDSIILRGTGINYNGVSWLVPLRATVGGREGWLGMNRRVRGDLNVGLGTGATRWWRPEAGRSESFSKALPSD